MYIFYSKLNITETHWQLFLCNKFLKKKFNFKQLLYLSIVDYYYYFFLYCIISVSDLGSTGTECLGLLQARIQNHQAQAANA